MAQYRSSVVYPRVNVDGLAAAVAALVEVTEALRLAKERRGRRLVFVALVLGLVIGSCITLAARFGYERACAPVPTASDAGPLLRPSDEQLTSPEDDGPTLPPARIVDPDPSGNPWDWGQPAR